MAKERWRRAGNSARRKERSKKWKVMSKGGKRASVSNFIELLRQLSVRRNLKLRSKARRFKARPKRRSSMHGFQLASKSVGSAASPKVIPAKFVPKVIAPWRRAGPKVVVPPPPKVAGPKIAHAPICPPAVWPKAGKPSIIDWDEI